ncbi:MAG: ATP-binding protein [Deltaproteobacteria bacterium]|nr:ATP-binding protein [Deltaproteobacteria bacterium]
MRLLAKNPADRFYGNARSVINALLTHSPDAFADRSHARGSYLTPEGNRHIGREREQEKLHGWVTDLIQNPKAQPPIIAICGEEGMGKTHLLEKLKQSAEQKSGSGIK